MNVDEMIALANHMASEYNEYGRFKLTSKHSGVYRTVTLQDQYAFKAVTDAKDAGCNRSEFDFYCMTTDEIREKLARPVYLTQCGRVIVMERVMPFKESEQRLDWCASSLESQMDKLVKTVHGVIIGDLHGGNFGVRANGDIVVVDYGSMFYTVRYWAYNQMTDMEKRAADWAQPDYDRSLMADMLLARGRWVA